MPRRRQSTLFLLLMLMSISIAGFIGLAAVAGYSVDRMSRQEDQEVLVDLVTVEQAYQARLGVERQVEGLRGYLLSGREDALAPWTSGIQAFDAAVAALLRQTHEPPSVALLEAAVARQREFKASSEALIALVRQGRRDEAQRRYLSEAMSHHEPLMTAVNRLITDRRAAIDRGHQNVDRIEMLVKQQLLLGALVTTPAILGLAGIIAWRVVAPLRELDEASRQMAAGRLHVRVTHRIDDEFGEVADAFNTMAGVVERAVTNLKEANEELLQLDSYKDAFLSTVTHELKTPLTAIQGFAGTLRREIHGPLNPRQHHAVDRILENVRRLYGLVMNLLDASAIRQGKLTLEPRRVAYDALVADTCAMVAPLAERKGLAIAQAVSVAHPVVLDPERIAQVLTNLLSNAIAHSPEGGVVSVRAVERDGRVITEVTDTGPGVPEDEQAAIFEPFTRGSAGGPAPSGTGLGLAIARQLVEAHGGAIGLVSPPGQGATFWFSLPLAGPDAA